jgi:hypothetical protein
MSPKEIKEILQRLTTRVSTGLSFIEDNYLRVHKTPDPAWIRNPYILLSFYSELLFKALYLYTNKFASLKELDEKYRDQGHNLERIGNNLGSDILLKYEIRSIKDNGAHEYHIDTEEGGFYVMDFIDIRYDFLDDRVRTIKGNEHSMFMRQIKLLRKINSSLSEYAWS